MSGIFKKCPKIGVFAQTEVKNQFSTEVLHIYWCAKEALYKYLDSENVNFISHMQIAPFEFGVSGHIKGNVLTNNFSSEIILSYEMQMPIYIYITYFSFEFFLDE